MPLTDLGRVLVAQLWHALINLGLVLPLDTPRDEYVTSDWPSGAEGFCGRYASAEGNAFSLSTVDGRLMLELLSGSTEVRRVTDDVGLFREKGYKQELKFYLDGTTGFASLWVLFGSENWRVLPLQPDCRSL